MKKHWWAFPFIGGILAFLGVLTPIAFFDSYFYIWMWGLVLPRMFDNSFEFIDDKIIFITGISTTIVIVLFSIVLIITSYLYRQGYFDKKKIGNLWIGCGVLILSGTIVSLVSLEFYTYKGNFTYGIWDFLNAGFGAMGPIFGSILAMGMGIIISFSDAGNRNRQQKVIPIANFAPKTTCPFCRKQISLYASFCSKCGKSIENENAELI
ncbi:hypothetical protein LCGC14_0266740 [marine sediment metagenome]|uniref:Zinc-ribbon domain-containing protein n=1 Tax=marine sediment metagenome TaxID=412755 RepID=A0A0F9WL03_9ZZZZ